MDNGLGLTLVNRRSFRHSDTYIYIYNTQLYRRYIQYIHTTMDPTVLWWKPFFISSREGVQFLFEGYDITSEGGYFSAILVIAALAFADRFLEYWKELYYSYQTTQLPQSNPILIRGITVDVSKWLFLSSLSLFHIIHLTIKYLLMLIIMSYHFGLFVTVVIMGGIAHGTVEWVKMR
jgi:hypothetical protein